MREQRVQWVVLPNGTTDDPAVLRLSVLVAPQLRTDEGDTLGQFPDVVSWPERVNTASYRLLVNGAPGPEATVVSPPADATLWAALFDADTPLTPYTFDDFADRPVVTYAAADVAARLRRLYARVAARSTEGLPRLWTDGETRGLDALLGEWSDVLGSPLFDVNRDDQRAQIVAGLLQDARDRSARLRGSARREALRGPLIEPRPNRGAPSAELERLLFFHLRGESEPVAMPPDGDYYRRRIDFHQLLGAIGDQPWLARRLGLVVDLTVPRAELPDADALAPRLLGLDAGVVPAPADPILDLRPATAYALGDVADLGVVFAAAPAPAAAAPAELPSGLVPLPESGYHVQQVDLDGAALKTIGLAATVSRPASPPPATPLHQPGTAGLPALRTSGVSLVHDGRGRALQDEFATQLATEKARVAGAGVTLYAEQLVRGYRLDVRDDTTGAWRSLHHRVTEAAAERYVGALDPVRDEGFFSVSVASAPVAAGQAPDPAAELYVHEAVVSWDGWSLSAPRPGAPLSQDAANAPTSIANTPFTQLGLSLQARPVPGTLPRLRFGRRYQLRLRTVDLAGNGPTGAEADARMAAGLGGTAALPAVPAPYLRFEPVPAPAVVTAMRYGEGASLLRLVIRSDRELDSTAYAAQFGSEPRTTEAPHPGYAGVDDRHLAPPKAAFELVERHGRFDPVTGADPDGNPVPAGLDEVRAAYAVARREKGSYDDPAHAAEGYPIWPEEQLELPYLPDPLATGAAFFGLPGVADGERFDVSFDADPWFAARPLRLRLADGVGPPTWDAGARVLTVLLPQAARVRIRVASLAADAGLLGMLAWCERELAGGDLDEVVRAVKENRCWLLTPWHELELVHAVQRPLAEPELTDLEIVDRFPGATSVDLHGEVELHVPSTERFDLEATWSEEVDDPAQPGPETRRSVAQVFDLSLADVQRYRDGHPNDDPYTLQGDRLVTFWTPFAARKQLATPRAHEFGDTRHRLVDYRVVATTPFREDFPVDWQRRPELLTAAGDSVTLNVLSSARPATPRVRHVVPTQRWTRTDDGTTAVTTRRGGGLRVWLDRPWYSSGDGELLGVLFSSHSLPDTEAPYVTLLAKDPLRAGGDLQAARPPMFSGATTITRVKLPEHPGPERPEQPGPFTLVGYTPRFDPEADGWWCDLTIDTETAYFPFVRLALLRYQPDSLPGCDVSRVVLADLVQTLPDRTATLVRLPGPPAELEITVTGPGYTAIQDPHGTRTDPAALGRVRVTVERADPSIADELLRWRPTDDAPVDLEPSYAGAQVTWAGRVPRPADDGSPVRLMVVEEDHLGTDVATSADRLIGRVVFAAAFEL